MVREEEKTKLGFYPALITIIGSVFLLLLLLLPYASSTEDYKEWLLEYADEDYMEGTSMTNEDAVCISLAEFMKMYIKMIGDESYGETSIVCTAIIGIFAVFSLLALFMSIGKKPIGIIVFDILSLIVFYIIRFDFKDRGVIGNRSYDWGIASYLGYVIGIIIFAGAVWMFLEKKGAKKSIEKEEK